MQVTRRKVLEGGAGLVAAPLKTLPATTAFKAATQAGPLLKFATGAGNVGVNFSLLLRGMSNALRLANTKRPNYCPRVNGFGTECFEYRIFNLMNLLIHTEEERSQILQLGRQHCEDMGYMDIVGLDPLCSDAALKDMIWKDFEALRSEFHQINASGAKVQYGYDAIAKWAEAVCPEEWLGGPHQKLFEKLPLQQRAFALIEKHFYNGIDGIINGKLLDPDSEDELQILQHIIRSSTNTHNGDSAAAHINDFIRKRGSHFVSTLFGGETSARSAVERTLRLVVQSHGYSADAAKAFIQEHLKNFSHLARLKTPYSQEAYRNMVLKSEEQMKWHNKYQNNQPADAENLLPMAACLGHIRWTLNGLQVSSYKEPEFI